jgi:hypothetical protein
VLLTGQISCLRRSAGRSWPGAADRSGSPGSRAPPVCGKQLVGNGGFESGISGWASTSGVRIASAKATPAFAGKWLARLGGRTAPRKDTLSQTVTIQSSCHSFVPHRQRSDPGYLTGRL